MHIMPGLNILLMQIIIIFPPKLNKLEIGVSETQMPPLNGIGHIYVIRDC